MEKTRREQFITRNVDRLLDQAMPGHSFTSVGINRFTHYEHGSYVELWPEPSEPGFKSILMFVQFSASSSPQATKILTVRDGQWVAWEGTLRPTYTQPDSSEKCDPLRFAKKAASIILSCILALLLTVMMGYGAVVLIGMLTVACCVLFIRPNTKQTLEINENMSNQRLSINAFIVGFFFLVATMIPGRTIFQIVAFLNHSEMQVSLLYYGHVLETAVGICGLITGISALIIILNLTFQMRRQTRNLPTSTVAGVSLGLVELSGVVRPGPGMAENEPVIFWENPHSEGNEFFKNAKCFYLEDSTGRILVDPGGVPVSVSGYSKEYIGKSTNRIILTRIPSTVLYPKMEDIFFPPEPNKDIVIQAFFPGDPVYVLGYACERPNVSPNALGPERLVVRPRMLPPKGPFPFLSTFDVKYLYKSFVSSRDYVNIFIMSDSNDERVVKNIVSLSSSVEFKTSLFLIVCSLLLIRLVNL